LWKILQRNFPHRRSSRRQNINLQKLTIQEHQVFKQTNQDKQASPSPKHTSWKKTEHFSDVAIQ
jgi:hypothetical protein